MPNILKGKVERVVIAEATSTTGKYWICLAQHLVKGFPCYDVLARARTSERGGMDLIRHYSPYNPDGSVNDHNKEHALAYWNEFRDAMCALRGPSQEDEPRDPMLVMKDGKVERWIN